MNVEQTSLPEVLIITPKRFADSRGFFSESWNKQTLKDAGVVLPEFVQDNHSLSGEKGTLRGLHYQAPPHAQGKLVRCGRGALWDVAVDARKESPNYGQWVGVELSFENARQLWVPAGFLHGFMALTDDCEIIYKCTGFYNREADGAVHWDSVGIEWPQIGVAPHLSDKDANATPFDQWKTPFTKENS